MRTPFAALLAAIACGLLIGSETTAFAWVLDLILVKPMGLSDSAARIGGFVGIGVGVAMMAWVASKVYRAEVSLAESTSAANA